VLPSAIDQLSSRADATTQSAPVHRFGSLGKRISCRLHISTLPVSLQFSFLTTHIHLYTGFTAFTRFHDPPPYLIPTYLIINPIINMRSFAVIAGFAASANAYAYGYPAYNSSSVAAPAYPAVSTPAGYPVASTPAGYPAVSSPAGYPVSSKAPEYTTKVITGLTTVCPQPTTITYAGNTYTVKSSTTLIVTDCVTTTTVPVKPSSAPVKPSSAPAVPVYTPGVSAPAPVVPYPSKNGTAPTYPVGTAAPTSTKPSPSQFTGAAAQTGAAMLAIVGAVAAFL
jgi:hypothetical protein